MPIDSHVNTLVKLSLDSYLLLLFYFFFGLWTASMREQSAVRGRGLWKGREGKGEVISIKVAFKGGIDVFVRR